MEQLTEFVSKTFTADRDRLALIPSSSVTSFNSSLVTTGVSTFLSLSSTPSTAMPFASLPLFRNPVHSFASRSPLHSVVERLNGMGPLSGLSLFNPAFHTSSQLTALNVCEDRHSCASPPKPNAKEPLRSSSVTSQSSEPEVTSFDTDDDNSTQQSSGN